MPRTPKQSEKPPRSYRRKLPSEPLKPRPYRRKLPPPEPTTAASLANLFKVSMEEAGVEGESNSAGSSPNLDDKATVEMAVDGARWRVTVERLSELGAVPPVQ